jgi:CHAT domain-containing protein/tetratricopeptide (TPR) repeat protein
MQDMIGRTMQDIFDMMPGVPSKATRLHEQVGELFAKGQYDAALPRAVEALDRSKTAPINRERHMAVALSNLGQLCLAKGQYGQVAEIYHMALGYMDTPDGQALIHDNFGHLYRVTGHYTDAEQHLNKALSLKTDNASGKQNPESVAITLTHLALVYLDQGKHYDLAAKHLRQAQNIYEEMHTRQQKPKHAEIAATLNNLALLYRTKGDYVTAERHLQDAQRIEQQGSGVTASDVAATANHLAMLYHDKGDYANAEHYYLEAQRKWEQSLGAGHPQVAIALNNLAALYHNKGDYERAEPLLQQTLEHRIKTLGPQHPQVAVAFNNLAELQRARGNLPCAEQLYTKALNIWQQTLADDHPYITAVLNNLAGLYRAKGAYAQAVLHLQKVLAHREKTLGANHPDVATVLNNLAELRRVLGHYDEAERHYTRALQIKRQTLGPEHPQVATILHNLAVLSWAKGEVNQAVAFMTQGTNVREHNLALILATGSEDQKRAYAVTLAGETDSVLSLYTRMVPHNVQARDLALTTVLRHKGRVLEAMADTVALMRRRLDPEAQKLLDNLTSSRNQLATLLLQGPGTQELSQYSARITDLDTQSKQLEATLSARSAPFRAQTQPVMLEAVQKGIPPEAVLVEIVAYRPFDPMVQAPADIFGPLRYGAFVVHREGSPAWVDLDQAKLLDDQIAQLREALVDLNRPPSKVRHIAQTLDEKLTRPLRPLLNNRRLVLLSPEGALNLVPFSALVDEERRYLLERFTFAYLTTGRDLLRLQTLSPNLQGAMILADPAYGERVQSAAKPQPAAQQAGPERASLQFDPLSETAQEATTIAPLLPEAQVLTQEQATEVALKDVSGPRVLHIATHGFFVPEQASEPTTGRGLDYVNPLLRSGLALAGANRRQAGAEDGLLTALEASGLDLWGTQLVVLSACETGVGTVQTGEGIYGLRRTFVLAGAETQVMSLWKVDDTATRHLMVEYYQQLLTAGADRAEALRQVQLAMLQHQQWQHPFFWASFIPSGAWIPLAGTEPGHATTAEPRPFGSPGVGAQESVSAQHPQGTR